ncbi:hypothetical protein JCGZ_19579 [Jatropha curcas]|uniref:Amidase domain-containing protein n=1 Tax=Jatropha curcas TaxID=180498 RepID=A0A067K6X5_JATCU|nr:hypothetical protein JCGZ_19579 [Jatropha curcas]
MATKILVNFSFLASLIILFLLTVTSHGFSIKEASVDDIQLAFKQNQLTSTQLVEFYIEEIRQLNSVLNGVIEINPDALYQANKADYERKAKAPGSLIGLHGIPILLKDNIGTKDKLNTTAGSFPLFGSVVPRDAGVVWKLRNAGAIILGKASMTEWAAFRSLTLPNGFSARGGQGKNPYVLSADPCGSSSGPAISVAANLVAVSLGTETDGSILCPSNANSVVGIKPTVGLTSRAGVVPISFRQDTIGPICRTVRDAVYVLDAIVGVDYNDGAINNSLSSIGSSSSNIGISESQWRDKGDCNSWREKGGDSQQKISVKGQILCDNVVLPVTSSSSKCVPQDPLKTQPLQDFSGKSNFT